MRVAACCVRQFECFRRIRQVRHDRPDGLGTEHRRRIERVCGSREERQDLQPGRRRGRAGDGISGRRRTGHAAVPVQDRPERQNHPAHDARRRQEPGGHRPDDYEAARGDAEEREEGLGRHERRLLQYDLHPLRRMLPRRRGGEDFVQPYGLQRLRDHEGQRGLLLHGGGVRSSQGHRPRSSLRPRHAAAQERRAAGPERQHDAGGEDGTAYGDRRVAGRQGGLPDGGRRP